MIQLHHLRGIALSLLLGIIAYLTSPYLPSALNSLLLALLLGIVISNITPISEGLQSGVDFTSSKLLELSILFLAFDINYTHIAELGISTFIVVAVVLFSMLSLTYFLSSKIKCPGSVGWLVGFGTAICGSSAIAALTPVASKNKEDIATSMAVVNLLGSLAMVLLPIILEPLQLSTHQLGLLLGGSLHSVGNVAGAGYSMSKAVGDTAITVKLARVALLSPGLIYFTYLLNKKGGNSGRSLFYLPWYLWAFIGITLVSSFISFPPLVHQAMESSGKFVLTIAMAAIGLKVSFKKLFQSGKKGFVFGLLVFIIQLLLLIVLM